MKAIAWSVVAALVLLLSGWIYVARYNECRAHGFTKFYCALGR